MYGQPLNKPEPNVRIISGCSPDSRYVVKERRHAVELLIRESQQFVADVPAGDLSDRNRHEPGVKRWSPRVDRASTVRKHADSEGRGSFACVRDADRSGAIGTVEARRPQARFTFAPTRSLSAVVRSDNRDLQTVVRIKLGARYAITPLAGFDPMYSLDSQHRVFDGLRSTGPMSRSVLSAGFTARWSVPDRFGTGRR